ncbi:MAG: sigma-70 family RNA polymerase sigma factor [Hyphomonadaceae bacterium]
MSALRPRIGLSLLERPRDVEASLWRRYRFDKDCACREKLVDRHLAMARAIARGEYRRRPAYGLERADFEQLAIGGLLEAIDRFDPLKGAPFETFARPRIRGSISDGIARSSESGAQFSHRKRLEAERVRSLREGRPHDAADAIADLAALAATLAIGLLAESASGLIVDPLAPAPGLSAYEDISWRELQVSVIREIDTLPDAQRRVLRQHYFEGVSFLDIARVMGLSKSRISQLHRLALARVRERLQRTD